MKILKIKIQTQVILGCRFIKEPFAFSFKFLYQIEDYIKPYPERSMFLWRREDIPVITETEQ